MSDRNDSLYLDEAAWAEHCATAYFGRDLADEAEGRRPRARAAARKDADVERGRLIFDDESPSASKPPGATMTEEELTQIRAEHERLEGYVHGFFGQDLSNFWQR